MKYRLKLPSFLISCAIIILGIVFYEKVPFLNIMELKTIDARFLSRGEIKPGSEVVIAVVDEKSIAREGKWVWPRSKFAALVTRLSDAGARVITFDIGFLEADDKRILNILDDIKTTAKAYNILNDSFYDYLYRLNQSFDNDSLLVSAIANTKTKIVIGYFFGTARNDWEENKAFDTQLKNIEGSKYKIIEYTPNAVDLSFAKVWSVQSNIFEIADAADHSGYFNIEPDIEDGVVRRISVLLNFKGEVYAPLSIISAGVYMNQPVSIKISEMGIDELKIGKLLVPTNYAGQFFINYRGGKKTFPHYSITDILHGLVPDDRFKDKIVIIGTTATGIYDMKVTPMDELFPGVEIHANIIDNILSKDFIIMPGWGGLVDILVIIITGLLLAFALPRTAAVSGVLFTIILIFCFAFLARYLFVEKGWILNMAYPFTQIILIYISITVFKYRSSARQKKFIRQAFSSYLSPTVVKLLIKSPEKLNLGGEERKITAFFSDIEGFTSVSEKLSPQELVGILNEFLSEMTNIILKYNGTVDKFEGDAIIAFFGAPNEILNQEEVACLACIEMQKKLIELRKKWKSRKKPELKMRIGLYSGIAVVGNMGSKNRMDYTMMGDTVNTAARLEGVNKVYGIYSLTGEVTKKEAGANIIMREVDLINVAGKSESINIYQIIGCREDLDKKTQDVLAIYAKALLAYRNQQWDIASGLFKSALTIIPDDGPSITMLKRCHEFIISPPSKNWDGAYSIKNK